MVDISGRSPVYDIPLCEALHKVLPPVYHLKLLALNIEKWVADIRKLRFKYAALPVDDELRRPCAPLSGI